MATPQPTAEDAALRTLQIKTRIITHMNNDHADSLTLFLQHYCRLPATHTACPKLIDITPSSLILSTATTTHNVIIPLKPPMDSLSGARARMVEMHHASLRGLGYSSTRVDAWAAPNQLWQWALTLLAALSFVSFPFYRSITPAANGLVYHVWSLGGKWPGLAWLTNRLAPWAWAFMVVSHALEVKFLALERLRRHRVEVGSKVWWCWVGNCFLTGVASLSRFDGLVGEVEGEKEKGNGGGGGH